MNCQDFAHTFELAPGDLLRLDAARGTTVRIARGLVWLTQERDRDDIVLREGDAFTVERDGLTLAQAQSASAVRVVESRGSIIAVAPRASAAAGSWRDRLLNGSWRSRLGALVAFS